MGYTEFILEQMNDQSRKSQNILKKRTIVFITDIEIININGNDNLSVNTETDIDKNDSKINISDTKMDHDNIDESKSKQLEQILSHIEKICSTFETHILKYSFDNVLLLNISFDEFCQQYPFPCVCTNLESNKNNKIKIDSGNLSIYKTYPNQIIKDKLFLGDISHAKNVKIIENLQITHIINCTTEENYFELKNDININVIYHKISILDRPKAAKKIKSHFNNAINFIDNALKNDNFRVLIHCEEGISRSATITIAYIMKSQQMKYKDALQFVKSKKKCNQSKSWLHQKN